MKNGKRVLPSMDRVARRTGVVLRIGVSFDPAIYEAGRRLQADMRRASFSNLLTALIADEALRRGVKVAGRTL